MDPTAAAYQGLPNVDKAFYDKVRESKSRTLVQDFNIPIRTGQAWKVPPISLIFTVYIYYSDEFFFRLGIDDRFPRGVSVAFQLLTARKLET